MAQLPAICDNCGRAFATGFGGSNARNATFIRIKQQCPHCGGFGSVPDGVYDLHPDVAILIFGPAASHEALRNAYIQLSQAVQSHSREDALEALAQVSPKVAKQAMTLSEQRFWNALQFLVTMLSFFLRSN